MPKITYLGAGSTAFAKNVLGDCMLTPALADAEFALFDIDHQRLKDSEQMLLNLAKTLGNTTVKIKSYHDRKEALRGATYVVNSIQVGRYDPCTITDFDIPKKYGLRQTIADTIGIGGLFRALRTIPVMLDFAKDMNEVCPDAWFLNYTNPMAALTGAMIRHGGVKTVGLCHSVQVCVPHLLRDLGIENKGVKSTIAGINHMAWLLSITKDGKDLYPEIKQRAFAKNRTEKHDDMVRYEIMKRFGHYVTESSEHNAEYTPYFIKRHYPELIDRFNIPLDEYIRRCIEQIERWESMREDIVENKGLTHERTNEYASYIMEAMETNVPYQIGGNVLNEGGLISNLPRKAVVEVPCLIDQNGVQPTYVGELPEQLAALNRTNINTQLLTIEAAITGDREKVYQAALLDPHTAAELSMDDIVAMCDEMIEVHGDWVPQFQGKRVLT
ncbi:alpha-glucosidase/alpha-galactosidase [Bacillaceae bacterium SIJ1]|uniref:alpha-glucosidase/alpha-galactosidase n=1 Tax=Litoribacterium kuwaitense TaxID=1398745 RepID=UPI0013EDEC43|nr:alpha-glucosidase/alpha-galactosidase [Litoribacterium kuwaitense]NGP44267.1 alpha-glucosidase/alpha-galactosidase [Litoribacterium kuwaitense]